MKKLLFTLVALTLVGCGASKRQVLKDTSDLIEKSKQADCETIHAYLNQIQVAIDEELKK